MQERNPSVQEDINPLHQLSTQHGSVNYAAQLLASQSDVSPYTEAALCPVLTQHPHFWLRGYLKIWTSETESKAQSL